MHPRHLIVVASSILIAPHAALATAADVPDPGDPASGDPLMAGYPNFIEWFRSHGGKVDDRVTIGYASGSSIRGLIATAPIPAGALLFHTPKSLVLTSGGDQCQDVEEIKKEMKMGIKSKWHTYFEFDDSTGSHVPTQWDRSNGPGRAMRELQGLPPSDETHRHIEWYQGVCKNGEEMTDLDMKGLLIFLTRSADMGLVPLYDLMNHHNGYINTRLEKESGGLSVTASYDIPISAPIYNTYARSGMESTSDVFNTYGFVEDYPQLWRWNDQKLVQLTQENRDHANQRYGMGKSGENRDGADRLRFEPNSEHYEVLVVSPTLAALLPTKELVRVLGNGQRSPEQWREQIAAHHANLRLSHANAVRGSALAILDELPTTIERDEVLLPDERRRLERVRKAGRVDVNKADAIRAIEYRLAFKKALRLASEVAERENFLSDLEEL